MNRGRYRKSNYRKRRTKTIILISVAAIIILFIIFLAVGLSLAEKTRDYEVEEDDFIQKESDKDDLRKAKNVNAYPLPLLEDGSSFASRLANVKEGATSVCVSLNDRDGILFYRSAIASKFAYLTIKSDASNLSSYLNSIDEEDLYTTATLFIPTFKENSDDLTADIELSIWGSVVCEAIRGGIGDVLLIVENATENDVERLCTLADSIHVTEKTAVIGLCLTSDILEAEKSVSLIDTLSKSFDYLAFDATNVKGEGTLLENTEQAIADMQLQLMYYKMRVLLPRGSNAEELDKLAEIVTKHSISSWQALPFN